MDSVERLSTTMGPGNRLERCELDFESPSIGFGGVGFLRRLASLLCLSSCAGYGLSSGLNAGGWEVGVVAVRRSMASRGAEPTKRTHHGSARWCQLGEGRDQRKG